MAATKKSDPEDKTPDVAAEETAADEVSTSEGAPAAEGSESAPKTPAVDVDPVEHRLMRLQADFDNYRKRMVRERGEWAQRALEDFVQDLLPVLDHYEMGLETARKHETPAPVLDGFNLVFDQLNSTLKKFAITPIEAEGETFDPNLHEAITHYPSPDHEPDVVISQTRKGYRIGERLLRPSQVVVSSEVPASDDKSDTGSTSNTES